MINTLIVIIILLALTSFMLLLSNLIKISFSVFMVIVGFVIAILAKSAIPAFSVFSYFQPNPNLIIYVCLPALIFESAFMLNTRRLRNNLLPILILAIPGLLLSTFIIAYFVSLLTSVSFLNALLLGAILSATDPVAVISLFQRLGTPKRLTILVEGESLFNDATAIVTAKVIAGIIVGGTFTAATVYHAGIHFGVEFFGGIGVGFLTSLLIGIFLGFVESNIVVEISLAVVLAYTSFIVAQKTLHVSGVMATLMAGVMMGGWGYTKISASVMKYLKTFLQYIASIANALIFLLIGTSIDVMRISGVWGTLAVVIVIMLASRMVVIFGLMPIVNHFSKTQKINNKYQTIMWWGGLRGAIALAIILGLSKYEQFKTLEPLIVGSVLFTLIVPALSLEKLVRWFRLDQPPLADQMTQLEGQLQAEKASLDLIPELQKSGLFSHKIAEKLKNSCADTISNTQCKLTELMQTIKDQSAEDKFLLLNCFLVEKKLYYDYYSNGHFTESAYNNLTSALEIQIDIIRYEKMLATTTPTIFKKKLSLAILQALEKLPSFFSIAKKIWTTQIVNNYEECWGQHQGSIAALAYLNKLNQAGSKTYKPNPEIIAQFTQWRDTTRKQLDDIAKQFPMLVADMQTRLGQRLMLSTREKVINEKMLKGALPEGVAHKMQKTLEREIWRLRKPRISTLRLDLQNMLRGVPFFSNLPQAEIKQILTLLKPLNFKENKIIIQEGEEGDSLFLIMHGVVRIIKVEKKQEIELASLLAGDFFGEMALLLGGKRTATCKTVTDCVLFELSKKNFEKLVKAHPEIEQAVLKAIEQRKQNR